MSNPKLNIGLYVSNLVDDSVYSVCSGASSAAKQLGAKYTIARIRDPEYTESLTLLQKKLDAMEEE